MVSEFDHFVVTAWVVLDLMPQDRPVIDRLDPIQRTDDTPDPWIIHRDAEGLGEKGLNDAHPSQSIPLARP